MKDGIFIGVSAHGLLASLEAGMLPSISTLEFSYPLTGLPEEALLREVQKSSICPVWRITIDDFESERRYFEHPSWPSFTNWLIHERDTLILAIERTSMYDAKQLDLLRDIIEAVYPLRCHLEFEHHSWSRAARVLSGARVSVVQHDAPVLPGIIKDIPSRGKHAILRLLGRDNRKWFEHHPSERFAYQYSNTELAAIARRVRTLAEESDSVTVIVATHPVQLAMEQARTLSTMLGA